MTPICEMEELSEVDNINLLKVDGITRKVRSKNSDPVRELKGPVLASHCNNAAFSNFGRWIAEIQGRLGI